MTLAEQLEAKVKALETADQKISDLEAKIVKFETEQAEFKAKLEEAGTEKAELETAKGKLETDLSESGAKCLELEKAKAALTTEKASLEGKLKLSPGHADLAPGADEAEIKDNTYGAGSDIVSQYMDMPAGREKGMFYLENMAEIDKGMKEAMKAANAEEKAAKK